MAKKIRLFDVTDIQLAVMESVPPQLSVSVVGNATTVGWSNAELVPLEKTLSPDGILDLEFVATPPDGPITLPAMTPMSANIVWQDSVERLIGVNIHTRTGETMQFLGGPKMASEIPFPWSAEAAAMNNFTTLAVGEEGPGPTTLALGEEGPLPTTKRLGEEGPGPTTLALGEEGPGTTKRLGEEGPIPTTLVPGEETPKTPAFGEETPKTLWPGEEGPKTMAVGEEGPKPWFGETDPRGETGTGTLGEDLDFPFPDDFSPFGRR